MLKSSDESMNNGSCIFHLTKNKTKKLQEEKKLSILNQVNKSVKQWGGLLGISRFHVIQFYERMFVALFFFMNHNKTGLHFKLFNPRKPLPILSVYWLQIIKTGNVSSIVYESANDNAM